MYFVGGFAVAHQKYFPLFVRNQDDEVNILVSSICFVKFWVLVCIGFAWQGFGSGGGYRNGFWKKLPLCPVEPMPAGSKMDPLLAKAEPISDGSNTSGIKNLRKKYSVPEGRHPMGGTHAGAASGELSPVGATPQWNRRRELGVLLLRRKKRHRQHVMMN